MENRSFGLLVEEYLGMPLPDFLTEKISFPDLPADARDVILRMLALMKRASCPATEINSQMIWLLSVVTPAMLPSAWGGRIPPLTSAGRHKKLDDWVSRQIRLSGHERPVFIDLGCGFPPTTTVDTARFLPEFTVYGVDQAFADYVLYDAESRYACFNRDGKFQYVQSVMKPLNDNPRSVQERFESLFADLLPELNPADDTGSQTVEKKGNRLVSHPVRQFETDHLKFVESGIETIQLPPARVIRCMNVLLYFEKPVRDRMLQSIGELLGDGGTLISGFNHPFGIYARYTVCRKDKDGLKHAEFAFSPDNLRPLGIGPWLTLTAEDQEAELLADLTRAIRADKTFWPEFNRRVDTLQAESGICRRGDDGYHHFSKESLTASPLEIMKKTAEIWHQLDRAGYTDRAVEALCRAGYSAWKNAVGDIAVLPPEGSLSRI